MSQERLYKVLLAPVVSEKAVWLLKSGQVVFKVLLKMLNKAEIKAAVEKMFDVKVDENSYFEHER